MYLESHAARHHFNETEALVRKVPFSVVAAWLLEEAFFPEANVVPPTFRSAGFKLQNKAIQADVSNLKRRQLASIAYPKTLLSSRQFSLQDPRNYHDIVHWLGQDWGLVLDLLYSPDLRIFSYSLPLPVSKKTEGSLGGLRAGRMIYEWIAMAENDLVLDATYYSVVAKTDIANFYSSVYTHSIAWALHGREESLADRKFENVGSKIDRLVQYANDQRTNGIPVGSGLSDLIAEIILSRVDAEVSKRTKDIDYVAVRFKDDYRFLCKDDQDARKVLRVLAEELGATNLILNERKTTVETLPHGLYRAHDRAYFPHSLKRQTQIDFKTFEHTLLIALDIHRQYPGTSILAKFLSELFDSRLRLKVEFDKQPQRRVRQLKKLVSLLFLAKRESEKILSQILAIVEAVYQSHSEHKDVLKPFLQSIVKSEIALAARKKSAFEIAWLIFFSRYLGLGLVGFKEFIDDEALSSNPFVKSLLAGKNKLFPDAGVDLFLTPAKCRGVPLVSRLDVFKRDWPA